MSGGLCQWQVWVCVHSDHGGIIAPTELSEPSGFWMGLSAADAAASVVLHGAIVRLSDEWVPAGFLFG